MPLAVGGVALGAGWSVYMNRLLPSGGFHWDEATHALHGLLIAQDLHARDWLAFAYDSYRQVYWPPLYSWLTGAAFLVFGPTTVVARSVSLVAFVLLAPVLFLSGRELANANRNLVGAVAGALALTSVPFAEHAAMAMIECWALLAFSLTLLAYMRLGRAGTTPRAHALLGLMVMLTYFLKANYGLLLLLGIVLALLIEADFRPRALRTRANGYAIAPVVVLGALWFAYPPKVLSTLQALINQPWGGAEARGFAGLLFYPRAFWRLSGSVWIVLLLLASLAAAWEQRRGRNVRLLMVLAIGPFVIGMLHHTKLDRHLLPVFPPLFLLAARATGEAWTRLADRRFARVVAAGVLAGMFGLQAKMALCPPPNPRIAGETQEIFAYVASLVRLARPALVLGTMGVSPGPPMIDWRLVVDERLLAVTCAGSISQEAIERRNAAVLNRMPRLFGLRDELLRVTTRYYDAGRVPRSFYLGLPTDIDPVGFDSWLGRTLGGTQFGGVVVITSLAEGARYPLAFVAPGLERAGLSASSSRVFEAAGLRVGLYTRAVTVSDAPGGIATTR